MSVRLHPDLSLLNIVIEKLGPGTNTKHKSKGEALGQSISLNSVYPQPTTQTFGALPGYPEGQFSVRLFL